MTITLNPNMVLTICFIITMINFLFCIANAHAMRRLQQQLVLQNDKFIPVNKVIDVHAVQINRVLQRLEYYDAEVTKIKHDHSYLQHSPRVKSA